MILGQTFRNDRRVELWKARPLCSYCGRRMKRKRSTLDHIIPLSRGGGDEPHNLALCCPECQQIKGDKTPAEWVDGILAGLAEFYVTHAIRIPDGWPFGTVENPKEER